MVPSSPAMTSQRMPPVFRGAVANGYAPRPCVLGAPISTRQEAGGRLLLRIDDIDATVAGRNTRRRSEDLAWLAWWSGRSAPVRASGRVSRGAGELEAASSPLQAQPRRNRAVGCCTRTVAARPGRRTDLSGAAHSMSPAEGRPASRRGPLQHSPGHKAPSSGPPNQGEAPESWRRICRRPPADGDVAGAQGYACQLSSGCRVDDAEQGVTSGAGADLYRSTDVHRLLQELLARAGLWPPQPILGADGVSCRNHLPRRGSARGATVAAIRKLVGPD
jgi:hypothetical protein